MAVFAQMNGYRICWIWMYIVESSIGMSLVLNMQGCSCIPTGSNNHHHHHLILMVKEFLKSVHNPIQSIQSLL